MSFEDKIQKLSAQRFTMLVILCNVLESPNVDYQTKAAISASLLNMLDSCMNPEDKELVELINHSIDNFCEQVEAERGITDFRAHLLEQVLVAKTVVHKIKEKKQRIAEADEILKGICLN